MRDSKNRGKRKKKVMKLSLRTLTPPPVAMGSSGSIDRIVFRCFISIVLLGHRQIITPGMVEGRRGAANLGFKVRAPGTT